MFYYSLILHLSILEIVCGMSTYSLISSNSATEDVSKMTGINKYAALKIARGNHMHVMDIVKGNSSIKVSTQKPTKNPTKYPTKSPTENPTRTKYPTTVNPTRASSRNLAATVTKPPTTTPSITPTAKLTSLPSQAFKSVPPTIKPTMKPTIRPSSSFPTIKPTTNVPPTSRIPTQFPTRAPTQYSSKISSQPSTTSTLSPSIPDFLTYHPDGTVIVKPLNLYNIYFGKFDAPTMDLMDYLGSTIGGSRYFSTVSTYYQVDSNGNRQYATSNATFVKRAVYNKGAFGLTVGYQDFYNVISALIAKNQLPVDTNGLYIIMFNGGFTFDGWNSLTDPNNIICGFHTNVDYSELNATLAVVVIGNPLITTTELFGPCTNPHWPNNLPGGDSMASIYAHELAEVVTDSHGDCWFADFNGFEIGDFCSWQYGDVYPPVNNTSSVSQTSTSTSVSVSVSENGVYPYDTPVSQFGADRDWNVELKKGNSSKYFALQTLYLDGYGCVNEPPRKTTKSTVSPTFRPSVKPSLKPTSLH